mmetsp:Transcript_65638/g.166477  ORF Transcript_65638/g.166477 Transcript_65638/m.166477 type:complete len:207 (-) Transcript_65638:730-1350(-)
MMLQQDGVRSLPACRDRSFHQRRGVARAQPITSEVETMEAHPCGQVGAWPMQVRSLCKRREVLVGIDMHCKRLPCVVSDLWVDLMHGWRYSLPHLLICQVPQSPRVAMKLEDATPGLIGPRRGLTLKQVVLCDEVHRREIRRLHNVGTSSRCFTCLEKLLVKPNSHHFVHRRQGNLVDIVANLCKCSSARTVGGTHIQDGFYSCHV